MLELLLNSEPSLEAIPQITDRWQRIRMPRVERIKAYAAWNHRMHMGEPLAPREGTEQRNMKSLKDVKPDMNANFHSSAFVKWAHDFDAVAEVPFPHRVSNHSITDQILPRPENTSAKSRHGCSSYSGGRSIVV